MSIEGGVPAGYKRTEVGVIPNDWACTHLGDVARVSAGGTPSRAVDTYWNGDIPWVTTREVDFCRINATAEHITAAGVKNSAAKLLPAETLLLALYGQGKTRGKVAILGIRAAMNQACAAIELHDGLLQPFVFYQLAGRYEEIRQLSNNGNQENLNGALVRSIPLALPRVYKELCNWHW